MTATYSTRLSVTMSLTFTLVEAIIEDNEPLLDIADAVSRDSGIRRVLYPLHLAHLIEPE